MVKADDSNKGFTLIEVIIVVFVIGVLATVSIIAYQGFQRNARDKSVLSDIDAMDGIQTLYGKQNNASGRAYYSGNPSDAEALDFEPSRGNIIDVVIDSTDYCIRGYNPDGNKNSIDNSYTKESSTGACSTLFASVSAGGLGSPIGWWKLNGNANDSSGQGHDGSVHGASLTTGQNGQSNEAYSFNGTNSYISLPGTWGGTSLSEITVSAWYYVAVDTGGFAAIVEPTGTSLVHMHLYPSDTGRVYVNTGFAQPMNMSSVPIGVWHNWVISSKSGDTASYLDGVLQGSIDTTSFDYITSTNTLQIGRGYAGSRYFNGKIDDVRIYDYALSPDRIERIYSAGAQ